jgi:hypothetical protein
MDVEVSQCHMKGIPVMVGLLYSTDDPLLEFFDYLHPD